MDGIVVERTIVELYCMELKFAATKHLRVWCKEGIFETFVPGNQQFLLSRALD